LGLYTTPYSSFQINFPGEGVACCMIRELKAAKFTFTMLLIYVQCNRSWSVMGMDPQ